MPDLPDPDSPIVIEAVRKTIQQACILEAEFLSVRTLPIIRQAIFFYYEGGDPGKWRVDRPHSSSARLIREATRGRFPTKLSPMVYDHAVPLDALKDKMKNASQTHIEMKNFLRNYIQGVVITKEEDLLLYKNKLQKRMPLDASLSDLTARYRAAGIAFEPADLAMLQRRIPN